MEIALHLYHNFLLIHFNCYLQTEKHQKRYETGGNSIVSFAAFNNTTTSLCKILLTLNEKSNQNKIFYHFLFNKSRIFIAVMLTVPRKLFSFQRKDKYSTWICKIPSCNHTDKAKKLKSYITDSQGFQADDSPQH